MGIVNVNDDSFSGDGTLDTDKALAHAREMIAAGADIIDVGAESARTNRAAITTSAEIARLQPFIAALKSPPARPLISVNTWRPEVTREILPLGIDLLNDIGALPDDSNARLCAEHGCALLIMHSVGRPKVPHTAQGYQRCLVGTPDLFPREDRSRNAAPASRGMRSCSTPASISPSSAATTSRSTASSGASRPSGSRSSCRSHARPSSVRSWGSTTPAARDAGHGRLHRRRPAARGTDLPRAPCGSGRGGDPGARSNFEKAIDKRTMPD